MTPHPPGGHRVLLPGRDPRHWARRRPRTEADIRGIVTELRPLAQHLPPPLIAAAVRRDMQDTARLLDWLRE